MALKFLNDGYFAGKVGIGTESPSRNLQVKGTANTAIAITSSTSSLAQLALGDTDDDNYAQIILDNSTNKLQIQNGGGGIISNRGITLDSSENVGIGTDDPIELLHLYGGVGNPTRIRLQADDGQDDVLTFHQSTTQKGAVGYDDSDDVVSLTYGGLSGTTGIKINSSGNVGIGTTNPLYKLHITDSTASGRAVQGIQSATSGTNYGAVFTAEGSGATKNVGLYADAQGATTNYAAIFDNGNVGIGTNNPVVKLQVNGGIRAVGATSNTGQIDASPDFGAFRFYNGSIFRGGLGMGQWASVGNSTDIVQYLNNVNYYISNGTTALLKVEPTGNVGIGTTSPDLKLDVTHATAGEYVATFQNTGSNLELKLGVTSTGYLNIQGQQINNSATFNMSLQADGGNVGINTTIPTQKLHVVGNARVTGAYYDSNNSPGTANQVLVSTATGTDWIDGSAIPGVPAGSGTLNTIPLWTPDGDTLGNSIITQPSTGVVRVSGNSVYFSVTDTSAAARNIDIGHWVSGQTNIESQGGTLSIGTQSNHNIVFETNGSTKATILSGGNVGINTTSPQSKLQVAYPGNVNGGSMLLGQGGSGTSKWSFLAGTHYNQASGSGNGAGSAGVALIGSFANSTTNVVYIGGGPYEINAATQIKFYTNSTNLSTQGGTHVMNIANDGGIRFNTYDGTNKTGTPTYLLGTDASGNIVKTTTIPGSAAGPYLPLAGGTMTGTGSIVMPDNFKLQLGNGIFSIFNDGTYSIIRSANEPLLIDSNGITFRGYAPYDTLATITSSGISIKSALLSNQENTDVDTGTETVASVAVATYTAAFFDFVIKKTTNVRSGTVYACHDGTNVEFTETSTQDLGDTSDVTLSVDISGGNMRLRATTTSDDWSIKSLIRAI
jgi:hypothetical protein